MSANPYLGEVIMFSGNFAPRGWAFCDGQLLAISSNTALFSIVGTVYGGDGRTSFGLPDMRARSPMGVGSGPGLSTRRDGQKGGAERHTMNITQMPNHGHSPRLHAEQAAGDNNVPFDRMLGVTPLGNNIYASFDAAEDIPMSTHSVTESNVGGSQPFDIESPFACIRFIIALEGVYPSRS